jgi:hypothetical protein
MNPNTHTRRRIERELVLPRLIESIRTYGPEGYAEAAQVLTSKRARQQVARAITEYEVRSSRKRSRS